MLRVSSGPCPGKKPVVGRFRTTGTEHRRKMISIHRVSPTFPSMLNGNKHQNLLSRGVCFPCHSLEEICNKSLCSKTVSFQKGSVSEITPCKPEAHLQEKHQHSCFPPCIVGLFDFQKTSRAKVHGAIFCVSSSQYESPLNSPSLLLGNQNASELLKAMIHNILPLCPDCTKLKGKFFKEVKMQ